MWTTTELTRPWLAASHPPRWPSARPAGAVAGAVARFEPIALAQLESMALMDRVDTKYLLTEAQLTGFLPALSAHYRVLEINQVRLSAYETVYFDTPDFALYRRHHDGRPNRYKVRGRRYADTNTAFMEVKFKTRLDRTLKHRVPTRGLTTTITPEVNSFLGCEIPVDPHTLLPILANSFFRLTLAGRQHPERVTIDLGLQFTRDGWTVALPGLVVAEVKRAGAHRRSPFLELMRAAHCQPTGFSKYCVGVALLYPEVKHNQFKPLLRRVAALTKGATHVH